MEDESVSNTLKSFDMYTDQLDEEKAGRGESVAFPAAFIRFNPMQWKTLGELRQEGELEFFVVVADKNYSSTSHKTSERERTKGLATFSLVDQVSAALQGWQPADISCGTLTRTALDPVQSLRNITSHVISFKCRVTDDIGMKTYIEKDGVSLNVTTNLETL